MLYQLSYSRWWAGKDSNLRRLSQQIYSLPPLATWVPAPKQKFSPCFTQMSGYCAVKNLRNTKKSWRRDSNPRPADYKSAALPAELRQQYESPRCHTYHYSCPDTLQPPIVRNKFKKIHLFYGHESDGRLCKSARPEKVQSEPT